MGVVPQTRGTEVYAPHTQSAEVARRSRKGLWYCTRDIPAARIRRLFGFVELARVAG
jgi:hypothetical protein